MISQQWILQRPAEDSLYVPVWPAHTKSGRSLVDYASADVTVQGFRFEAVSERWSCKVSAVYHVLWGFIVAQLWLRSYSSGSVHSSALFAGI